MAKTNLDEAIEIYTTYTGNTPRESEIVSIWHKYANNWKAYADFEDYLRYNGY